jgi:hypothetical protein
LANTQLFTPGSTVVTQVAYAIAGVLLVALVCNVFLFIYAMTTQYILTEQLAGMLGNAALIEGIDVADL